MNKTIFVSYYTENTPYEEVIKKYLLPSLKKFNLKYDIKAIKDLGNWGRNTSYKATFMLEMLEKYKCDIVFLDADAKILKHPVILFQIPPEYDIAVHYLDWHLMWRNQTGNPKRELLSGTMLFRYNEKVITLTKKYIEECKKSKTWEQRILQKVITNTKDLNIYKLPPQYCAIIKRDNSIPDFMKEPVILHHQVSRQLKNKK